MTRRASEVDVEREKYDMDDRKRCKCRHDDGGRAPATNIVQCLNSTRHPSGYCTDCRVYGGRA